MEGGLWNPPRPPIAHRQEPTTPKELAVRSLKSPQRSPPAGHLPPSFAGVSAGVLSTRRRWPFGRPPAFTCPLGPQRKGSSSLASCNRRGPRASESTVFPVARRHRAAPACTAGARASALERARGSLKCCCPVGYPGQCGRGYGHLRFPEPRVWAGQTLGIVLFLVVEGHPTWKLNQQAVPRQLLARRLALDSQTLGCFCVLPTAGLSQNLCRWLPNCHFLPRLR